MLKIPTRPRLDPGVRSVRRIRRARLQEANRGKHDRIQALSTNSHIVVLAKGGPVYSLIDWNYQGAY